jgi:hypothetical protein
VKVHQFNGKNREKGVIDAIFEAGVIVLDQGLASLIAYHTSRATSKIADAFTFFST